MAELKAADRVIGFNIINFDYEVLKPYAPNENFRAFRSIDMLLDISRALNFRLKLDSINSEISDKLNLLADSGQIMNKFTWN